MKEFKFKKKYGQNFLKDDSSIEEIVSSIAPKKNDLIVEIGPGAGALTRKLKNFGCHLIAFEIDHETSKYLTPLEDDNTEIIYEDFLKTDIASFLKKCDYDELYFLGNLPYYITTPIIEHIIDSKVDHVSLTIMVQKEVADRFLAHPGNRDYGYMTVLLNLFYDISKVIDVPRKNFYPQPNVDSAVLKLTKKETPNVDYMRFKAIVKEAFQFKRKNIWNNLKKYDKVVLESILKSHGKSLTDRAEDLDLSTFIDLTNNL